MRPSTAVMEEGWVRAVAYFELIGGVLIIAGGWLTKHDAGGQTWVSFPFVLLIAAGLSIAAGLLLLNREQNGVLMSLLVQGCQVVNINIGWRYVFLVGPKITLLFASTGVALYGGIGGQFSLSSAPTDGTLRALGVGADLKVDWMLHPLDAATWTVGVNMLAAYFFVRLWRLDDILTAEATARAKDRLP
jgi:hypothetical protein